MHCFHFKSVIFHRLFGNFVHNLFPTVIVSCATFLYFTLVITNNRAIMHLKSLRLYILFLAALGYQTEGCILFKAEIRAEEKSPARSFFSPKLNPAESLEHEDDDACAVKPNHIQQIVKDSRYHHSSSFESVPGSSFANPWLLFAIESLRSHSRRSSNVRCS